MPIAIYNSLEEATAGVQHFIRESGNAAFITARREKYFGTSGDKLLKIAREKKCVHWNNHHFPYTGIPFIYIARRVLQCHRGYDKNKAYNSKKSEIIQKERALTHQRYLKRSRSSKKVGCPARITMWHIAEFPDFQLEADANHSHISATHTKRDRNSTSRDIIAVLKDDTSSKRLQIRSKFITIFPPKDCHVGHLVGMVDEAENRANTSCRTREVLVLEADTYLVNSAEDLDAKYVVRMGNDAPSCECPEWQRVKLPCQHMTAVWTVAKWPSDDFHDRILESSSVALDGEAASDDDALASGSKIVVELQTDLLPSSTGRTHADLRSLKAEECRDESVPFPFVDAQTTVADDDVQFDSADFQSHEALIESLRSDSALLQKVCVMRARDVIEQATAHKDLYTLKVLNEKLSDIQSFLATNPAPDVATQPSHHVINTSRKNHSSSGVNHSKKRKLSLLSS